MLFDINDFKPKITTVYLLEHYTEEQLYKHYYPDFHMGMVNSPFRSDSNASFSFYEKAGVIKWKDHGTREQGGVFAFIERIYIRNGYTLKFNHLLEQIERDLSCSQVPPVDTDMKLEKSKKPKAPSSKQEVVIQVVETVEQDIPLPFLRWWEEDLSISRNILNAYHVGFAEEVWIDKYDRTLKERVQILWARSNRSNPIFYYYFPKTGHFKCYRPFEKNRRYKWIGNVVSSLDIQGCDQCSIETRKPSLLILTKSMKDVMFLRSFGIDAMAMHGEGNHIDPKLIAYLQQHCGLVISLYDNDNAGMRGGLYLRNTYGIPCYFIPRYYGAKDCTDMYQKDKRTAFILIDLLNEVLKDEYKDRYTGIRHEPFQGLYPSGEGCPDGKLPA